jgi:hypothetical protein
MLWALETAPVDDQGQLLVLIALADRAGDDGTAAWPSISWIAERARCSTRTVIRHLHALRATGLISLGDQQLVAHLAANRRPQVYDLDLSRVRGDTMSPQSDVTQVSPQIVADVTPVSPLEVSAVSPQKPLGVTGDALWGDTAGNPGVTLVSHKPSLEPSLENRPLLAVAVAPADEPKTRPDARGTRIPEPFVVTDDMIVWAREHTPLVGRAETDRFIDHWSAIAGARGRKTNWVATWRNWMRRAQEDAQNRAAPRAGFPSQTPRGGGAWNNRVVLPGPDDAAGVA